MDIEIIEYLVSKGVNPSEYCTATQKSPRISPLQLALTNENLTVSILKFFKQKTTFNMSESEYNYYFQYTKKYDMQILEFFFENGFAIKSQLQFKILENENLTVLALEYLMNHGLRLNFHFPYSEIDELLDSLSGGEDSYSVDTPFESGCININNIDLIHKMIEYGGDLNFKRNKKSVFEKLVSKDNLHPKKFNFDKFVAFLSTNLVSPKVLESSINACKRNENLLSLLLQYQNDFIWSKEYHKYFPSLFRSQTETFLKCIHFLIKNKRFQQTFPKPIIWIIVKYFSIFPDLK